MRKDCSPDMARDLQTIIDDRLRAFREVYEKAYSIADHQVDSMMTNGMAKETKVRKDTRAFYYRKLKEKWTPYKPNRNYPLRGRFLCYKYLDTTAKSPYGKSISPSTSSPNCSSPLAEPFACANPCRIPNFWKTFTIKLPTSVTAIV